MGNFLGQEQGHSALHWKYRYRPLVGVQDQLAAVAIFPVRVKVTNERDHPVGFTAESIDVGTIEIARAVMRQVTFKREQAHERPAVEMNSQRLRPVAPGREGRVTLIQPVDSVAPDEGVTLLFGPPADGGCVVAVGAQPGRIIGERLRDVRR